MRLRLIALLLYGLLPCLFLSVRAADKPASSLYLDGSWEGTLKGATGDELTVRMKIAGASAEVHYFEKGKWAQLMPGKLNIVQSNFNAIVYGNDQSLGDCWDESVSFTMALGNANKLLTQWSRAVSNVRCLEAASGSFSKGASGTLSLSKPEAGRAVSQP